MGAKGIRTISEKVRSGHPGQVAGSARKKIKKKDKVERLCAEARAAGVSTAEIRKRHQQEVNQCRSSTWMKIYKPNDFVPERRRGFY